MFDLLKINFKQELMQKILSTLSHDQRSVTPKNK